MAFKLPRLWYSTFSYNAYDIIRRLCGQFTHRPQSSSFLWLPCRIPYMNPRKELLWGLWVTMQSISQKRTAKLGALPEGAIQKHRSGGPICKLQPHWTRRFVGSVLRCGVIRVVLGGLGFKTYIAGRSDASTLLTLHPRFSGTFTSRLLEAKS